MNKQETEKQRGKKSIKMRERERRVCVLTTNECVKCVRER